MGIVAQCIRMSMSSGNRFQCVSDEHVQWELRFNVSVMNMSSGNQGSVYKDEYVQWVLRFSVSGMSMSSGN